MSKIESLRVKAKLLQKAKRKAGKEIQLKEAFSIIAKTAGFNSWNEYKSSIENSYFLARGDKGSSLHLWFRNYEEAKEYLNENGGFLFQLEKDFVIVSEEDLIAFGVKPSDPDLLKVGNDFYKPEDTEAMERVLERLRSRTSK